MAMSHPSRGRGCFAFAVAICFFLPGCFSNKIALEIFERACHCFDDHNVYSYCEEEFRLRVEGAFHVGKETVDEYCGGPCLAETKLALQCVEEIADEGFRFSNGASVQAVREALGNGCSYTPERGSFEIRERKECGDEYYHRHVQEQQLGYGEEQYHGGAWGEYCYGGAAAGRVGLLDLVQMLLLLFFVVAATLLPVI